MNASPNMAGKDRNAVKRSIFRRTPNWRAGSLETSVRTGCATLLTVPLMKEYPIVFHLLDWV